jgi:hypothetical protein
LKRRAWMGSARALRIADPNNTQAPLLGMPIAR